MVFWVYASELTQHSKCKIPNEITARMPAGCPNQEPLDDEFQNCPKQMKYSPYNELTN